MTQLSLAVNVQNLSHSYGKMTALCGLSLQIPQGKTVGLIGPDGVGKSTLLSLISGAKVIQSGTISVFDQNIANKKEREALSHKIAFMPQGLGKNLYLTLSIYDNVDFHASLFGLPKSARKALIQRLLNTTGLAPFADRPAGKLSGGMKQKLSLCCALVHSPDLLILDEPTTGVDPLSRRQFWELVENLRQESPNMTVIVATAYIDEAEGFEHVIAMDDGKIIADKKVVKKSKKAIALRPHLKQAKAASEDTLKVVTRGETQEQIDARGEAALAEQNDDQIAGNITLVGNPELVAGATILLKNLGVFSGKYLIKSSRHSFGRNSGYTTEIEVRMLEFIADDLITLGMEATNANA